MQEREPRRSEKKESALVQSIPEKCDPETDRSWNIDQYRKGKGSVERRGRQLRGEETAAGQRETYGHRRKPDRKEEVQATSNRRLRFTRGSWGGKTVCARQKKHQRKDILPHKKSLEKKKGLNLEKKKSKTTLLLHQVGLEGNRLKKKT